MSGTARPELKALHLTRDFYPRVNGGLSVAVGQLVAAMAAAVRSRVISADGWRRGAPADPIAPSPGVFRAASPDDIDAARAWGRAHDPDVTCVHDPWLFELGAAIAGDRPIALWLHTLAHHQDRLRGLDRPTRSARAQAAAIAGATAVIAPSESVAAIAAADFPGAAKKIVCAPLAADDSDGARRAAAARPRRPATGALLFCGRFSDMAGVDRLAAIADRVGTAHPDAELVIAGGLPDNPRADRRWRRRLEAAPVRLTGWLDGPALERERAAADVLIAPARFATFGMAILEAMLYALPVVAYRTGAIAELVVDGETGLLADPDDPAALATAAASLLADRERALGLGAAGRERALAGFGWSRRIEPVIDLFGRLVEATPRSR